MNPGDNLLNILFKKQKWIEAFAIFFVFLGVSFKFGLNKTEWLWADYPYLAILIAGVALMLALIWLRIEKSKIQNTINSIQNHSNKAEKIDLLTGRQQEVFQLILQNKTNKQISEELFIELSTLKTHINKIYKTLDINSRKETKRFKNLNLL